MIAIILVTVCGSLFAGGSVEIEGDVAYLKWEARINLANEGALKAIVHMMGSEVYSIAKKNSDIKEVQVSLYYTDLIDKYGNNIPTEDAFDSTFTIDNLDEVRKYKDGLRYGLWKFFDIGGKVLSEINYINGIAENQESLDKIESERLKRLKENKGKILDPANFINNPQEYFHNQNR